MTEAFKPIAIRPPSANPLLFAMRCVIDLQLLTTYRFLARELPACRGRVLDVGAGEAPWRELLSGAEYVGLDVESAAEFGMQRQPGIVYYPGGRFPFDDASFACVMTSEVLEHVPDPAAFAAELARVLAPGGRLILTVPWSARLHHLPNDYFRFTRYALRSLVEATGLQVQRLDERGNDVAVVANKLIVIGVRLLLPKRRLDAIWTWPLALLMTPVILTFVAAAHVALRLGLGSREDPLGYGLVALKP
jgi:SAM-dependent methyltransferase